ncbi:MAG TPA: PIN domain-containing protein [Rhizomicrobium sp.]|jgi:hypothetical protein
MEVQLVADTNLYFECMTLEELPWHELRFDPIVVLLTKPVLDEIDKHKKANGRTRKRALEIFQRIRAMLATSATETVIQEHSPRVILRRSPNVVPDTSLVGTLDYTRNDDRLIGIVATLNKEASAPKIMLFTDDTGPAAAADGLGLPFTMIPQSWRRPEQQSTEEKRIVDLEKDLATYRSQEPKISIDPCIPADDSETVTVTRRIAEPLTELEIEELLSALRLKHPMKTEFTPTVQQNEQSQFGAGDTVRFDPPDEEEVKNYQDALYPQWLDKCRKILADLHQGRDEPEEPVILRWRMSNDGTRPASQVRVQFEAQGPLKIARLRDVDEEPTADETPAAADATDPNFPSPPRPPSLKRVVTQAPVAQGVARLPSADISVLGTAGFLKQFEGLDAAARAFGNVDHLFSASRMLEQAGGISHLLAQHQRVFETPGMEAILRSAVSRPEIDIPIIRPFIPPAHDAEAFYYDDWPTMRPVKRGALTCDLWRHQNSEEVFEFGVVFTSEGQARGSVLCTVHAENLTRPETSRISVVRKVETFKPLNLAHAMIERC